MGKTRRATDFLAPRKSSGYYNKHNNRIASEEDALQRKSRSDRSGGWYLPSHKLEKWMAAQVGRPWDKVYSEFCRAFPRHDEAGRRAHEHLEWIVDLHATMLDEDVKSFSFGRYTDLNNGDLYVHPLDGLLKKYESNH